MHILNLICANIWATPWNRNNRNSPLLTVMETHKVDYMQNACEV